MSTMLRVTVTALYEANPESYGTDEPAKMALIDQESFQENPEAMFDIISNRDMRIKVEPEK